MQDVTPEDNAKLAALIVRIEKFRDQFTMSHMERSPADNAARVMREAWQGYAWKFRCQG